jgi:hypothetical protein
VQYEPGEQPAADARREHEGRPPQRVRREAEGRIEGPGTGSGGGDGGSGADEDERVLIAVVLHPEAVVPFHGESDRHDPDGSGGGKRGQEAGDEQQTRSDLATARRQCGEGSAAETVGAELLRAALESPAAQVPADLLHPMAGDEQAHQQTQDQNAGVQGDQPAACAPMTLCAYTTPRP